VDFIRTRAIPALIAASWAVPAAAAVDCAALEGIYRFEATKATMPGEPPETLADFLHNKDTGKLYRIEERGGKVSFAGSGTIQRGKSTPLATKAALKYSGGKATLRFMDGEGKLLAEHGIGAFGNWSCNKGRLERGSERMAGLGDSIRTERVDELLERNPAGDLVHRTTVTTLEPRGVKPAIRESVFPAIR